jgi:hypothetical protein
MIEVMEMESDEVIDHFTVLLHDLLGTKILRRVEPVC